MIKVQESVGVFLVCISGKIENICLNLACSVSLSAGMKIPKLGALVVFVYPSLVLFVSTCLFKRTSESKQTANETKYTNMSLIFLRK